jgi:hypothetical protein
MVRQHRRLVALLVVLGALTACGSGFIDKLFAGPYDSTPALDDAGTDAATDARCALRHPPPPPQTLEENELPSIAFAMDALYFDGEAFGAPLGLDLDNACTCQGEPPEDETCLRDGGRKRCDALEGRDNEFAPLFLQFVDQFLSRDFVTEGIQEGKYTGIISLSAWNGQPNDPRVTVAILSSRGTEPRADGGAQRPRFDGTDKWTIDPDSLSLGDALLGKDCAESGECLPQHITFDAYVRDDVLVAPLANAVFALSTRSGRIAIDFGSAVLIAHITRPDGGPLRLAKGELVGRFRSDRFLAMIGQLDDPDAKDGGFCSSLAYTVGKAAVCGAVDIAAVPADDGKGKACTAVSGGLGFTAVQAQYGTVFTIRNPPNSCATFQDSCP